MFRAPRAFVYDVLECQCVFTPGTFVFVSVGAYSERDTKGNRYVKVGWSIIIGKLQAGGFTDTTCCRIEIWFARKLLSEIQ